ncbi:hypothetical protein K7X08_036529 [Anisodus acutangulus]|uniref:glutathione transferase n=1 Tax=Anisodus acutangulus TaxID=402998 RepID=A0A9Q1L9R2_9SOLA|nr:hypothetical protein K7X08_036529 [Anisodus acutangulus]
MAGSGEESKKLQLYSYWRSSCAFRVRIALNLKGLEYEYKAVNLLTGEQRDPEYLKLNPLGYVPTLVNGDAVIADSFAIIMYLEEKYPQRALLPQDLQKRAINYQAANIVAANIQPLQNLAVLKYIQEKVGPNETTPWVQTHIRKGFEALEKLLKDYAGKYATGDEVYVADLFLAPQIHAAIKRFEIDMNQFPTLLRNLRPSIALKVSFKPIDSTDGLAFWQNAFLFSEGIVTRMRMASGSFMSDQEKWFPYLAPMLLVMNKSTYSCVSHRLWRSHENTEVQIVKMVLYLC